MFLFWIHGTGTVRDLIPKAQKSKCHPIQGCSPSSATATTARYCTTKAPLDWTFCYILCKKQETGVGGHETLYTQTTTSPFSTLAQNVHIGTNRIPTTVVHICLAADAFRSSEHLSFETLVIHAALNPISMQPPPPLQPPHPPHPPQPPTRPTSLINPTTSFLTICLFSFILVAFILSSQPRVALILFIYVFLTSALLARFLLTKLHHRSTSPLFLFTQFLHAATYLPAICFGLQVIVFTATIIPPATYHSYGIFHFARDRLHPNFHFANAHLKSALFRPAVGVFDTNSFWLTVQSLFVASFLSYGLIEEFAKWYVARRVFSSPAGTRAPLMLTETAPITAATTQSAALASQTSVPTILSSFGMVGLGFATTKALIIIMRVLRKTKKEEEWPLLWIFETFAGFGVHVGTQLYVGMWAVKTRMEGGKGLGGVLRMIGFRTFVDGLEVVVRVLVGAQEIEPWFIWAEIFVVTGGVAGLGWVVWTGIKRVDREGEALV